MIIKGQLPIIGAVNFFRRNAKKRQTSKTFSGHLLLGYHLVKPYMSISSEMVQNEHFH